MVREMGDQKKIAELEFEVLKSTEPKPSFFNLNSAERENFGRHIKRLQFDYDVIIERKPALEMPPEYLTLLLELNLFYSLRQLMVGGIRELVFCDDFFRAVENTEFYGWRYWCAPDSLG
mgnify:CR=1 FL=1